MNTVIARCSNEPWNRGKLVGQKRPLRLRDIWAIRIRLHLAHKLRDLALFYLAIDSKPRACDRVKLRVRDIAHGSCVAATAVVIQRKTRQPVQFEITKQTRESTAAWIQATVDLPADQEPSRGSTAARPYQAGEHRSLPGHRRR